MQNGFSLNALAQQGQVVDAEEEGGVPADDVAQEQYEFLRDHAKMMLYGEKSWQKTIAAITENPDTAFACGEIVGMTMFTLVSKAEDDSGAEVDADAVMEAGRDMVELLYDSLGQARIVNPDASEEEDDAWFERAMTAAYGAYEQGQLATGRKNEEAYRQDVQDLMDMMKAGELAGV